MFYAIKNGVDLQGRVLTTLFFIYHSSSYFTVHHILPLLCFEKPTFGISIKT